MKEEFSDTNTVESLKDGINYAVIAEIVRNMLPLEFSKIQKSYGVAPSTSFLLGLYLERIANNAGVLASTYLPIKEVEILTESINTDLARASKSQVNIYDVFCYNPTAAVSFYITAAGYSVKNLENMKNSLSSILPTNFDITVNPEVGDDLLFKATDVCTMLNAPAIHLQQ